MRRTSFRGMDCPIARSLERVGAWWSMLILRDCFAGLSRFDEFERSLGIAPNTLTCRLATLVKAGMLQKRRYSARPLRHEYILTERGRDFRPVLLALLAYGNRHFSPKGASVMVVNASTGEIAESGVVDRRTGQVLAEPDFEVVAGPAANAATRARLASRTSRLLAKAESER